VTRAAQGGLVVALLALSVSARARAEPRELVFDPAEDGAATGLLAGGFLIAQFGTPSPSECYVCAIPAIDLYLAAAIGSDDHPETYARISDLGILAMLLASVAASPIATGELHLFAEDLTILSQAVFAMAILNTAVKRLSARPRPAFKLHSPSVDIDPHERYVSFFSGHTALAATLAGSVTALAYLRGYGYRHVALGVGLALSLTIGVLRMAAQRHWFTDVLTGWIVGAALGVFIPLVLHPREDGTAPAEASGAASALRVPQLTFAF
jgi:membrane-associated phospholipid phosphatase